MEYRRDAYPAILAIAMVQEINDTYSESMTDARVQSLQRKLNASGHRVTPQRLHILRALLTDEHPTAEAVWEKVREVSPTTTLGTIYKTLDTLKAMGEVIELETRDDKHHYDAVRPVAHPHVICSRCGKIEDVDIEGVSRLQSQAAQASGYQIDEPQITFYGRCRLFTNFRS